MSDQHTRPTGRHRDRERSGRTRPLRAVAAVVGLALAVTACGQRADIASDPEGDTARAVAAPTGAAESAVVSAEGITWILPRSACLERPGDVIATADAASAAAARVRHLIAEHVAGWPTTTVAARAHRSEFYIAVNRLGPTALALGEVSGTTETLIAEWSAFESGYADPVGTWGPVQEISRRLSSWRHTAAVIVAELETACG